MWKGGRGCRGKEAQNNGVLGKGGRGEQWRQLHNGNGLSNVAELCFLTRAPLLLLPPKIYSDLQTGKQGLRNSKEAEEGHTAIFPRPSLATSPLWCNTNVPAKQQETYYSKQAQESHERKAMMAPLLFPVPRLAL